MTVPGSRDADPNGEPPSPATDAVEIRKVPPNRWYRLGPNPLKMAATLYVCEVCKLLPISVKNAVYRGIGDDVTLAAHSFVNRDVEPGERVGGNPIETL
ncbi:hypothetical protein BRD09_03775 [Halobacteriales archaeon SW_10_68_16]|nr:MAG: hypothetical protein BRD09_03775 [Halobacteriales archaeon SW_10_68_16]